MARSAEPATGEEAGEHVELGAGDGTGEAGGAVEPAAAALHAVAAEERFTIDELAVAACIPTRTIRHYQSEGALAPPAKQGRVAYYGRDHLERLELIARLQDRGLSLKVIRDALREVEKGRLSLEEWLGVGDQLRVPWSDDAPVVWSDEELDGVLGSRPGLRAALLSAGLVRDEGLEGAVLVPSPALVDLALALDAAGIDVETAAGGFSRLRKHLHRSTDDVVKFFLSRTGDGFGRSTSSDDIGEALDALRLVGAEAVRVIFTQEIERSLRARARKVST